MSFHDFGQQCYSRKTEGVIVYGEASAGKIARCGDTALRSSPAPIPLGAFCVFE
jgi:hypothetical protein